ncbi:3-hydroxyacyl-CoA dehydrogenase family protein [Hephaestia mangrovi]|uniref:3-hydroxyacyl-CoA dehydrogenase family protein n=1 Tax=Hephaestia mangrovi TaxID=2873268 RepID=UPI001CA6065D|nr:3-hydroxyacyl-CoA dehydrogenase family protein [Hephaestia mangrovi]MBY8829910.1 3-hydroxyacyl-CoA dehydrogenase family protein [Hephaestia mangrovi]
MSAPDRGRAGSHQRVAVIGAGLMGSGIAQVFAYAGHEVRLFDQDFLVAGNAPERIRNQLSALGHDPSIVDSVLPATDLATAVGDVSLVIECVKEDLATKRALFAEVEPLVDPDTVLASNTSVIPISQIMEGLARPERALGTHWWNPPYLVPLVEVVGTASTSAEVVAEMMSLLAAIGKIPVHVRRDVPGFIGNRLQHAMWREAIALVADGVCDAATLDLVVKNSFGMRLGVLGPMENADLVGLDLTLAVHRTLFPDLARDTAPSTLLQTLVAQGHLGMKTGGGFQVWPEPDQAEVRTALVERLRYPGPEGTRRAVNRSRPATDADSPRAERPLWSANVA